MDDRCEECQVHKAIGMFIWTPGILRPWDRNERFDKQFKIRVCARCRDILQRQTEPKENEDAV